VTKIVDYSEPWMLARKALQKFHHAMLRKEHDAAIDEGVKAIAEIRLAIAAVRDLKERHERAN